MVPPGADQTYKPRAAKAQRLDDFQSLARFPRKTGLSVFPDQEEAPNQQEPHETQYLEKFSKERI